MRNITPPRNLKPQKQFFPEVGEEMVNGDGIIRIMQTLDTPKAKAINKAFMLRYSEMREADPAEDDQKRRNRAIVQAIEDQGRIVTMRPLSGNGIANDR